MLTLSENNYFLSSHTPIFIQKFISIPKRFLIGGAGGGDSLKQMYVAGGHVK